MASGWQEWEKGKKKDSKIATKGGKKERKKIFFKKILYLVLLL